ncbi:hypothetical protein WOC76_22085 [Methylocystis sp. IM3]|uniref:hypothetical protein n=1 Tax=unclassified Methylocystis TaxID=2625913 RepID=UPI0030FBD4EF
MATATGVGFGFKGETGRGFSRGASTLTGGRVVDESWARATVELRIAATPSAVAADPSRAVLGSRKVLREIGDLIEIGTRLT